MSSSRCGCFSPVISSLRLLLVQPRLGHGQIEQYRGIRFRSECFIQCFDPHFLLSVEKLTANAFSHSQLRDCCGFRQRFNHETLACIVRQLACANEKHSCWFRSKNTRVPSIHFRKVSLPVFNVLPGFESRPISHLTWGERCGDNYFEVVEIPTL